jgi:hypothetical protein
MLLVKFVILPLFSRTYIIANVKELVANAMGKKDRNMQFEVGTARGLHIVPERAVTAAQMEAALANSRASVEKMRAVGCTNLRYLQHLESAALHLINAVIGGLSVGLANEQRSAFRAAVGECGVHKVILEHRYIDNQIGILVSEMQTTVVDPLTRDAPPALSLEATDTSTTGAKDVDLDSDKYLVRDWGNEKEEVEENEESSVTLSGDDEQAERDSQDLLDAALRNLEHDEEEAHAEARWVANIAKTSEYTEPDARDVCRLVLFCL